MPEGVEDHTPTNQQSGSLEVLHTESISLEALHT